MTNKRHRGYKRKSKKARRGANGRTMRKGGTQRKRGGATLESELITDDNLKNTKRFYTLTNTGSVDINGTRYMNQCLWISIVDFLNSVKRNVPDLPRNVRELKTVLETNGYKLNNNVLPAELLFPRDETYEVKTIYDALQYICNQFNINIHFYALNTNTGLLYNSANIDSYNTERLHTLNIYNSTNVHFEPITKIFFHENDNTQNKELIKVGRNNENIRESKIIPHPEKGKIIGKTKITSNYTLENKRLNDNRPKDVIFTLQNYTEWIKSKINEKVLNDDEILLLFYDLQINKDIQYNIQLANEMIGRIIQRNKPGPIAPISTPTPSIAPKSATTPSIAPKSAPPIKKHKQRIAPPITTPTPNNNILDFIPHNILDYIPQYLLQHPQQHPFSACNKCL